MKPCSCNRKLIAWLALDELDGQQAATLRAHLADCEGCRGYWEEISKMTDGLAAAQPDPSLEASEVFHRRMERRLRAVESGSVLENLAVWLRDSMLNWRVAVPAVAVLGIALVAVVAPRHPTSPSESSSPRVEVVSAADPESDLAPTIANYHIAASQSSEKLSKLLDRQASKPLPSAPLYTVLGLASPKAPY